MPDIDEFKNLINKHIVDDDYLHGYKCYLASYIFLANYAYNYSIDSAPKNDYDTRWISLYPVAINGGYYNGYHAINNTLAYLNGDDSTPRWSAIYSHINGTGNGLGAKFTKEIKISDGHTSLLILGMALHCAMDALHIAHLEQVPEKHI